MTKNTPDFATSDLSWTPALLVVEGMLDVGVTILDVVLLLLDVGMALGEVVVELLYVAVALLSGLSGVAFSLLLKQANEPWTCPFPP